MHFYLGKNFLFFLSNIDNFRNFKTELKMVLKVLVIPFNDKDGYYWMLENNILYTTHQ